jgi:hypothetical protein
MMHLLVAERLTADDDPNLWDLATTTLLGRVEALPADAKLDVYAEVGCCHHWISPHHPIRWMADGGFAWPFGYNKTTTRPSYCALPAFTWSVFLKWTGEKWEPGRTGKRCLVFRISIPARTARHRQAAIHTVWTPRSPTTRVKPVELFGFRKQDETWRQTASEVLRGVR